MSRIADYDVKFSELAGLATQDIIILFPEPLDIHEAADILTIAENLANS